MKKLFISQPMKDKTDEEILNERKEIIKKAYIISEERELEVIDSFFGDDFKTSDKKNVPLYFLSKSLEKLVEADIAIFASGWENYRGCRIEHAAAVEYGIKVISLSDSISNQLMDFSDALLNLKDGKLMCRDGWNGKNMCVAYQKGYPEGIACNKNTANAWFIKEGSIFKCNPYFQIKNQNGSFSMWVPSIGDVLAEDWRVYTPEN